MEISLYKSGKKQQTPIKGGDTVYLDIRQEEIPVVIGKLSDLLIEISHKDNWRVYRDFTLEGGVRFVVQVDKE